MKKSKKSRWLIVVAVFLSFIIMLSAVGPALVLRAARQPEVADKLRTTMIIAAALIEGVALFAVAVCFMAL